MVAVSAKSETTRGSCGLQQFAHGPHVAGDSCRHGGRHAERLVATHEIVPREMQTVCSPKVFPLLAESIRQASEATHLHSDGEVLALHVGRASLLGIGISHDWDLLRAGDIGRAIPAPLFFRSFAVDFNQLREIASVTQCGCYGGNVGLKSISTNLEPMRSCRATKPLDKGVGGCLVAASKGEVQNQL